MTEDKKCTFCKELATTKHTGFVWVDDLACCKDCQDKKSFALVQVMYVAAKTALSDYVAEQKRMMDMINATKN